MAALPRGAPLERSTQLILDKLLDLLVYPDDDMRIEAAIEVAKWAPFDSRVQARRNVLLLLLV